ncbi:MAG: type II toxin-antitoxin system VapC family toxin [Magnetococcus sp. DMHC-1]|nr:type II toxin-antitoxin system VapC family toxin [Magnetococcales bacterium]
MIGLDTNVLVRFLLRDDPVQSQKVRDFMNSHCTEASPCLISSIVLCELAWVLESCFSYSKHEIHEVLARVLQTSRLRVENVNAAQAALRDCHKTGADFSDSLIGRLNRLSECDYTATFDKRAGRLPMFRIL